MGSTFLSPADFIADLANPALGFLPNALMIAVLGAVICGVIGTHVTLRGMAFLGDAVAHAVFPGLAIAFALQVSVLLGGAVAGIVIALLIAVFSQRRRVKEDTIIGIFFAASFALGLVIIAQIDGYTASLTSFLFGSITGVARSDIYIVALGGAVIMAMVWLFHSRLVAVSLDRETARAMGLNVLALDMLLYVCVTMAVVMSVRTVGNILVLALLITPAAMARLFTERVVTMMWVSAFLGAVGAVLGVYISWAADVPTGATIVLVLTAMFILSFLVSPRHGVFGRGGRGASVKSKATERRVVGAAASVIALFGAFVAIPASSDSLPAAVAQDSDSISDANPANPDSGTTGDTSGQGDAAAESGDGAADSAPDAADAGDTGAGDAGNGESGAGESGSGDEATGEAGTGDGADVPATGDSGSDNSGTDNGGTDNGATDGQDAEQPKERPQHRPGYPSDNPIVPKDTIDPRTGKTHVCAGKKLLYQAHVDALYGTYRDGKLAVMVVDGSAVANAEDVCIRLAPDADNDGKELSRLVVPPGDQFSFLGKPGDILWHAPQQVDMWGGWRPVWAGAGAFDPHHEYEVPKNFVKDQVKFSLVGADKPGNVEMFFYSNARDEARSYISTKNGPTHFNYEVGAHGHFGWTFSKAGQYTFTWQASTETTDGKKLVSKPTPITWLVGSDEEVGLPEGTTKNLNPIKKSAEDQRDELFPDGVGGKPGESETPGDNNPGTEAPGDNGGDNGEEAPGEAAPGNGGTTDPDYKPIPESSDRASIRDGHMDLAFNHKAGQDDVQKSWDALLIDGHDPSKLVKRPSGTFEFVIDSDQAKINTPKVLRSALEGGGKEYGKKLWQIPQTQQEAPDVPWLGFNTEESNYGKLSKDGVKIGLKDFEGPGRMVTARGGIGQFDVLLDSANRDKTITFRNPTHDHQAFMFSTPGRYRAVFEFQATTASGEKVSKELEAYFLVAPKEMNSGGNNGDNGNGPGAGPGDGTGGIGDNGGDFVGESSNELVGILNETTGMLDSVDTGLGYIGNIIDSVRGFFGHPSSDANQPELQPEITPGDAHSGDTGGNGNGATGGNAGHGATGGNAGNGATGGNAGNGATGGNASGPGASAGARGPGASGNGASGTSGDGASGFGTSSGFGSPGFSSPGSAGALDTFADGPSSSWPSSGPGGLPSVWPSPGGLSSEGAAPLPLDAMAPDGELADADDAADDATEEELDGIDLEDLDADGGYVDNTPEGAAARAADKDKDGEPDSKAIQLANALGQGGWIGGLMFGMGGMALLGGMFFAFVAWRLMRNHAAMAGGYSADYDDADDTDVDVEDNSAEGAEVGADSK